MARLLLHKILFFVLVFSFFSKAADQVEIINSTHSSIEDAISAIYVSAPANPNQKQIPKLVYQEDLAAVEVSAIRNLIVDQKVDKKEKEIVLIRYTLGNPEVTKALIEAKKAGIKVTLITDLNPVMEGDFSQIQGQTTSAFSKAKLKDPERSPGARTIQDLLDAGFEIKKDIISQPLYSPELDRKPIMHEKALLLRAGAKKKVLFGTANLAPNLRYNRMFQIDDPVFFDRYQSHVDALTEVYVKGKETKQMTEPKRTIIRFQDGTQMEMAFTGGRFNPNERIVNLLNHQNHTLEHIDLSHFVITHRGFLEALQEALRRNPQATGFAITDDRFSAIRGWGLAPSLAGVDTLDPYLRKITGFSPQLFNQIEGYVYQRPAIEPDTGKVRIERSENGPPSARHVWHDKTTLIDFSDHEGGKKTALFTGSFNLSNNSANSEFQVQMDLPRDSWIREAVRQSIQEVVKSEPQWAIPNVEASLRNTMGLVFGVTDIEVPMELNKALAEATRKRDFQKMRELIKKISEIKTKLFSRLEPEEKQKRLDQFFSLINWFEKHIPASNSHLDTRIQKLISASLVIAQPQISDHLKATLLSRVIERPEITIPEQHRLLNALFKTLNLGKINPWSGMRSKIFSIEDVFSPEFVKKTQEEPHRSLEEHVRQKILEGDSSWQGRLFLRLISTLGSEKRTAVLTLISSNIFSKDEILGFLSLLNDQRKQIGFDHELFPFPKDHILLSSNTDELELALLKAFRSHAKKGVVSSLVHSSDPNLLSVLRKIKREQDEQLKDFQIKLPQKTTDSDKGTDSNMSPDLAIQQSGLCHDSFIRLGVNVP